MEFSSLRLRLGSLAGKISDFLAGQIDCNGRFPSDDYYGRAFSAALWAFRPQNSRDFTAAIRSIELDDHNRKDFHKEFVKFAMLQIQMANPKLPTAKVQGYRGTRVANWTLLRAYCRLSGSGLAQRALGLLELIAVRLVFGRKRGLIEDDRAAYTMQYHAFSCALLGEICRLNRWYLGWATHWHKSALQGLSALIMPDGECNYIGRGAFQSFGYSSAVLALIEGARILKSELLLRKADLICKKLEQAWSDEKALPLVVWNSAEGSPESFDLLDEHYPGWWSYNRYYDYLAFSGLLLEIASRRVDEVDFTAVQPVTDSFEVFGSTFVGDILIYKSESYQAVVAPRGRICAASMPFPYVWSKYPYPAVAYGGEERQANLYSPAGLPLPTIDSQGIRTTLGSMRYRWINQGAFRCFGDGFTHNRRFYFETDGFEVTDTVEFYGAIDAEVNLIRLMLPMTSKTITINSRMLLCGKWTYLFSDDFYEESVHYFSPNGWLKAFAISVRCNGAHQVTGKVKAYYEQEEDKDANFSRNYHT